MILLLQPNYSCVPSVTMCVVLYVLFFVSDLSYIYPLPSREAGLEIGYDAKEKQE